MLPPEEPERTRHVDRRSLLEEDVAPVIKPRAEEEEEAEALGIVKPPGSPRGAGPGGDKPFVGPGGGAYRGDKSLQRMC